MIGVIFHSLIYGVICMNQDYKNDKKSKTKENIDFTNVQKVKIKLKDQEITCGDYNL